MFKSGRNIVIVLLHRYIRSCTTSLHPTPKSNLISRNIKSVIAQYCRSTLQNTQDSYNELLARKDCIFSREKRLDFSRHKD